MNRTDIYTGSSSAAFAKVKPKIEKMKQVKNTKRSILISNDAGKIILDELQKEINALHKTDFDTVKTLLSSGIKNALEIDMLSKAMAADTLESIKFRINNIIRNN
jgi:hypothetical protein